jgi:hypothetical protein
VTVSIDTLFTVSTAERILETGLELLAAAGVDTTSWQVDDPVRVLFKFAARVLETRDEEAAVFIKSGFLTTARGSWKTLVASEFFGVERDEATYATSTVTLSNGGGGYFELDAGRLVVKNSTTGVTYHSTEDMVLASGPGTTTTVEVIADEAGTAGNAGVDEIDDIVIDLIDVTISSSTQAVGADEQSEASLETECLESLGALSPNGPSDAYNYVVKQSSLTGSDEITRAQTLANSSTGAVTVYVAGASGAVSGAAVTAAQDAVEAWATPNCITPTVTNSTEDSTAFAFNVSGTGIPGDYEATLSDLIGAHLAELDVGGLIAVSATTSIAHQLLVDSGVEDPTVTQTAPASDVDLADGHVATLASCTVTEV